MIKGVGIDLCSVKRMEKAVERAGFAARVFSKEEREYAQKAGQASSHYAAAFAAKEALAKACGIGLWEMGLDACRVIRTENGPVFALGEAFSRRLEERGIKNIFLSISHEEGTAAAVVVLEG